MKNSLLRNIALLLAITLVLMPIMNLVFGDPLFSANPMRFFVSAVILSLVGGYIMTWFQEKAARRSVN